MSHYKIASVTTGAINMALNVVKISFSSYYKFFLSPKFEFFGIKNDCCVSKSSI